MGGKSLILGHHTCQKLILIPNDALHRTQKAAAAAMNRQF
jgi:hypothetical protein